eukprot:2062178-Heterocapsa_arctica.AAC.1
MTQPPCEPSSNRPPPGWARAWAPGKGASVGCGRASERAREEAWGWRGRARKRKGWRETGYGNEEGGKDWME